uniref:Magnesium transporter n=1 Tax=Helicotheca tamesis TaxID=374047 RepID=A0A7S2MWY3_9STRA|mmetsp:Transcript_5112/g.7023  ORF Transcript_5112/g.7023 Transcript_5112/m.7023 type:complete len:420 (+) Transcript_5112:94-1353(+)|eukprot:CAMPEP_0185731284 /NCGR_PEP_ID=MMETSP1171-20130828/12429_1 /TAXON_ID=374046 /ORGANISM="Helicotheca tamensis, Strain CCMP826" /LENGTH=419 /DNA_ID=CAMNT_0028400519 /DNA_START=30 /DNA_END=1289 /DNA_ORIENTATION=-
MSERERENDNKRDSFIRATSDRSIRVGDFFIRKDIENGCGGETELVSADQAIDEKFPLLSQHILGNRDRSFSDMSDRSIVTFQALPGMKIRSHGVRPDCTLYDCTSKEALVGAKKGKQHYWIDIDADERDTAELKEWLSGLKLPRFFLSVIAERSETWASQVVALKKACITIVRYLPKNEVTDEVTHLAALSLPNLLLTFTSVPRSETGELYSAIHAYMHTDERLPSSTASGVMLAWMRFHMDRTSRSVRLLRSRVLKMDEVMDRDIAAVSIVAIIEAKEQLLRLLAVAEEQNECVEALSGAEADTDGLDFSGLKGSLSVLQATAAATERTALRLEKHIADLRQRYEGHQHDRTNRRLAVLTVISAIFLPLTLFSGIWGMNFDYMPELTAKDGYFMALLLMVTIACSMLFWFWKTGWFD